MTFSFGTPSFGNTANTNPFANSTFGSAATLHTSNPQQSSWSFGSTPFTNTTPVQQQPKSVFANNAFNQPAQPSPSPFTNASTTTAAEFASKSFPSFTSNSNQAQFAATNTFNAAPVKQQSAFPNTQQQRQRQRQEQQQHQYEDDYDLPSQPQQGTAKSQQVCRFYNTPAGCRRGEACEYAHVATESNQHKKNINTQAFMNHEYTDEEQYDNVSQDTHAQERAICHFYNTPVGCRRGNACQFRHVSLDNNNVNDTQTTTTSTSAAAATQLVMRMRKQPSYRSLSDATSTSTPDLQTPTERKRPTITKAAPTAQIITADNATPSTFPSASAAASAVAANSTRISPRNNIKAQHATDSADGELYWLKLSRLPKSWFQLPIGARKKQIFQHFSQHRLRAVAVQVDDRATGGGVRIGYHTMQAAKNAINNIPPVGQFQLKLHLIRNNQPRREQEIDDENRTNVTDGKRWVVKQRQPQLGKQASHHNGTIEHCDDDDTYDEAGEEGDDLENGADMNEDEHYDEGHVEGEDDEQQNVDNDDNLEDEEEGDKYNDEQGYDENFDDEGGDQAAQPANDSFTSFTPINTQVSSSSAAAAPFKLQHQQLPSSQAAQSTLRTISNHHNVDIRSTDRLAERSQRFASTLRHAKESEDIAKPSAMSLLEVPSASQQRAPSVSPSIDDMAADELDVDEMSTSDRKPIIGTCPDMCPALERLEREEDKDLSIFECVPGTEYTFRRADINRACKKYKRSAAAKKFDPSNVRPPPVLMKTLNYLVEHVVDSGIQPFSDCYKFVQDRMRAIRNDFSVQAYKGREAILAFEQIARYHILSIHEQANEPPDVFDQTQNMQKVTQTLTSLGHFYNDNQSSKQPFPTPNEGEMRGYTIMTQIGLSDRVQSLLSAITNPTVRTSPYVVFAIAVHQSVTERNYAKFFNLLRQATYLQACLMHKHFRRVRSDALKIISRSYPAFPLSSFTELLCFDTEDDAYSFCQYHGMIVTDDGQLKPKESQVIIPDTPYPNTMSQYITRKRNNAPYRDVIQHVATSSIPAQPPPQPQQLQRDPSLDNRLASAKERLLATKKAQQIKKADASIPRSTESERVIPQQTPPQAQATPQQTNSFSSPATIAPLQPASPLTFPYTAQQPATPVSTRHQPFINPFQPAIPSQQQTATVPFTFTSTHQPFQPATSFKPPTPRQSSSIPPFQPPDRQQAVNFTPVPTSTSTPPANIATTPSPIPLTAAQTSGAAKYAQQTPTPAIPSAVQGFQAPAQLPSGPLPTPTPTPRRRESSFLQSSAVQKPLRSSQYTESQLQHRADKHRIRSKVRNTVARWYNIKQVAKKAKLQHRVYKQQLNLLAHIFNVTRYIDAWRSLYTARVQYRHRQRKAQYALLHSTAAVPRNTISPNEKLKLLGLQSLMLEAQDHAHHITSLSPSPSLHPLQDLVSTFASIYQPLDISRIVTHPLSERNADNHTTPDLFYNLVVSVSEIVLLEPTPTTGSTQLLLHKLTKGSRSVWQHAPSTLTDIPAYLSFYTCNLERNDTIPAPQHHQRQRMHVFFKLMIETSTNKLLSASSGGNNNNLIGYQGTIFIVSTLVSPDTAADEYEADRNRLHGLVATLHPLSNVPLTIIYTIEADSVISSSDSDQLLNDLLDISSLSTSAISHIQLKSITLYNNNNNRQLPVHENGMNGYSPIPQRHTSSTALEIHSTLSSTLQWIASTSPAYPSQHTISLPHTIEHALRPCIEYLHHHMDSALRIHNKNIHDAVSIATSYVEHVNTAIRNLLRRILSQALRDISWPPVMPKSALESKSSSSHLPIYPTRDWNSIHMKQSIKEYMNSLLLPDIAFDNDMVTPEDYMNYFINYFQQLQPPNDADDQAVSTDDTSMNTVTNKLRIIFRHRRNQIFTPAELSIAVQHAMHLIVEYHMNTLIVKSMNINVDMTDTAPSHQYIYSLLSTYELSHDIHRHEMIVANKNNNNTQAISTHNNHLDEEMQSEASTTITSDSLLYIPSSSRSTSVGTSASAKKRPRAILANFTPTTTTPTIPAMQSQPPSSSSSALYAAPQSMQRIRGSPITNRKTEENGANNNLLSILSSEQNKQELLEAKIAALQRTVKKMKQV